MTRLVTLLTTLALTAGLVLIGAPAQAITVPPRQVTCKTIVQHGESYTACSSKWSPRTPPGQMICATYTWRGGSKRSCHAPRVERPRLLQYR